MPAPQVRPEVQAKTRERLANIAGGAAGDLTVTGIKVGDEILNVINMTTGAELATQFEITADDTINNTGGTSSAGARVLVRYYSTPTGGV